MWIFIPDLLFLRMSLRFKEWNIGWYAAPDFEVMQLDESRVVVTPVTRVTLLVWSVGG